MSAGGILNQTRLNQKDEAGMTLPVSRVPAYSWYILGLLTVVYVLASFDRSIVSVVMEPIGAEFQLSDQQLGFLAGLAFGIPYALASLPFVI